MCVFGMTGIRRFTSKSITGINDHTSRYPSLHPAHLKQIILGRIQYLWFGRILKTVYCTEFWKC